VVAEATRVIRERAAASVDAFRARLSGPRTGSVEIDDVPRIGLAEVDMRN
jgi:hypothetical protein